jgi:ribosomal protein RSM22 (predicted rRNA methylase)
MRNKIESILEGCSLNHIVKERQRITRMYRENDLKKNLNPLTNETQRLAYLAARLPATYAAVCQVLMEALRRSGGGQFSSLLDIGAGPGTALLAANLVGLPLIKATMVERDPGFIALGKRLTEEIGHVEQQWICQDVVRELSVGSHDMVIASYCLNELTEKDRMQVVEKIWNLTSSFLILIEPGSHAAFESLKKIRQFLLFNKAHLVAPCPHSNICPLAEKDWCHFSVRVQRSSVHRKAKEATLNYEDENFSYLIFSKNKLEPCHSRVLRSPFKGQGYIKLQLCSKNGLDFKTITKKNKPLYSYARKIECGEEYCEI